MKKARQSLKALIADELAAAKIMSYEDLKQIAINYGTKVSVAERRLRFDEKADVNLPVIKLNAKRRPIKNGEPIAFYKWVGGKTVFK